MGRIICIANQKGGVGKTTSAVNLSASIALAGKKTLLVDCDYQGNASSSLGLYSLNGNNTLYNLLLGQKDIAEITSATQVKNLMMIPSNIDLVGAETELKSQKGKERLLQRHLASVKERFDYIILDCPPSLGLLTLNALTASNSLLIPLQCEYFALEGITALMRTFKMIRRSYNPLLALEGVLLTMYDKRTNLSRQVESDIRKHFKDKVFRTVIPRNVRLSEAPSHNKPIMLYDIKSPGAQSYLRLAKEILNRHKKGA